MRRINLLHACGSPTSYQYRYGCRCSVCRSAQAAGTHRYWETVRGPETAGSPTNIETPPERRRRLRRENRVETAAEYSRRALLWKLYGLTPDQWSAILARQGGRCAICGTDEPKGCGWHTDHCHETGVVRGILCTHCNSGLGFFRDNPAHLVAAIEYLQAAS